MKHSIKKEDTLRINEAISVPEVQVVDETGKHIGKMSIDKAIERARKAGLDLIEVSAKANPPVTHITDYGKYLYNQNKKVKEMKSKQKETSKTKNIQIKPGTGVNELELRGKKVGEWISKGHRVRIDLFLWGRYKYMDKGFLKERLESFLPYIVGEWEISEQIKESPKGFSVVVQKAKGGGKKVHKKEAIDNKENDKDKQSTQEESENNI